MTKYYSLKIGEHINLGNQAKNMPFSSGIYTTKDMI